MTVIRSWKVRANWWQSNTKGIHNGCHSQSGNQNILTHAYRPIERLVDHDVPRSGMDKKPTKFLLDLYNREILGELKNIQVIKRNSHSPGHCHSVD